MATLQSMDIADQTSVRQSVSEGEWRSRVNAAAGYRLVDLFGMSDLVEGVVGTRVEDEPDAYLLQPYGMFFDEVRASDLVKVRFDDKPDVGRGRPLNYASSNQVKYILQELPEINCVIHTHTLATSVVATLKEGILPLNQYSFVIYNHIGKRVDFQNDIDEACVKDMIDALDGKKILLLPNHGLLTVGKSVAEAFYFTLMLEEACQCQLAAMQTGSEIMLLDEDKIEAVTADYSTNPYSEFNGSREWPGFLRKLDRERPGYDT